MKSMRAKRKNLIRELRQIIGQTQTEFATMIGASKDAVASWETDRNQPSPEFAKRIEFATGAPAAWLVRKRGKLLGRGFAGRLMPYSWELFREHKRARVGRSDEVSARAHANNCYEALELLFMASARPVRGERNRLPAVVQSFIQWCEATRKDFKLEREIDEELGRRVGMLELTHTWREWRRKQRENPDTCRVMGFRDDPKRAEGESLTLKMQTVPVWMPGYSMRGQRG